MARLQLTIEQVKCLIPQASEVRELDQGGQKLVFTGIIDGEKYALKFMSPNPQQDVDLSDEFLDDVTARAQREVETMQQCSTPHLVRMGPIGLQVGDVAGKPVIYFSEEFIEGENLHQHLQDTGPLPLDELIRLAFHISEAVRAIWQFSKIHRDIKPSNIMRCDVNGEFVLLDMGLVFDLQDASISVSPVGTPLYFSPEQMDFDNRRTVMNFRSDLFSLGIVLYEMATGRHPFITATATTTWEVLGNIVNMNPEPPISLRPELPQSFNEVILRLLAKRPALRYRSIDLFQRDLRGIEVKGGVV
jgi:serine/threonine protein kinase